MEIVAHEGPVVVIQEGDGVALEVHPLSLEKVRMAQLTTKVHLSLLEKVRIAWP